MTTILEISKRVFSLAKQVQEGRLDPLEVTLTEEYQTLQRLAAGVAEKLDLDEMLNIILESKVTKIQELARILATPDLYVECLRTTPMRRLGRMIAYRRPLVLRRLHPEEMMGATRRVMVIIDALSREPPEEQVPEMAEIPEDFALKVENPRFMEEMSAFEQSIPTDERIPLTELLRTDSHMTYIKRFIFTILLISEEKLTYFEDTKEILRPSDKK